MPGRAVTVGLIDRDVQAAVADCVTAVGKPPAVTELSDNGDGGQLSDAVIGVDQRLAADLSAGVVPQLSLHGGDLPLEHVDHRERDRDLLTRGRGQRLGVQPVAPVTHHQLPSMRTPVVIEHRLDPLLPLAVLLNQRVTPANNNSR